MPSASSTGGPAAGLPAGQRPEVGRRVRELVGDRRAVEGRARARVALAGEDRVDVLRRHERGAGIPPALRERLAVTGLAGEQRDRDVALGPVLGVDERVDTAVLDGLQRDRVDVGAADEELAAGPLLDARER